MREQARVESGKSFSFVHSLSLSSWTDDVCLALISGVLSHNPPWLTFYLNPATESSTHSAVIACFIHSIAFCIEYYSCLSFRHKLMMWMFLFVWWVAGLTGRWLAVRVSIWNTIGWLNLGRWMLSCVSPLWWSLFFLRFGQMWHVICFVSPICVCFKGWCRPPGPLVTYSCTLTEKNKFPVKPRSNADIKAGLS